MFLRLVAPMKALLAALLIVVLWLVDVFHRNSSYFHSLRNDNSLGFLTFVLADYKTKSTERLCVFVA